MSYIVDDVRVPGAVLHTETTGAGPTLLLIPGGGGDAEMYAAIVPPLAARFTVVTFDRRGNSRSPLDGASTPVGIAEQACDAVAVLDHHRIDRAYVFGSSAGAIIALELLAEHDGRLLGALVHEPPLMGLLPGGPEQRELDELRRIADTEGPLGGFVAFATVTMPHPPALLRTRPGRALVAAALRLVHATASARRRVTGRAPGGMARLLGTADILLRRELPALYDYRPDLAALRSARPPWWAATGRDSAGRPYDRPVRVLGERLGVPRVEFPGGYTAYQQQAEEFARCLIRLLNP